MLAALVFAAVINAQVGDLSVVAGYVEGSTETDRIRGHLMLAHDVLAQRDTTALSPALRAARARNLDRLLRYARAGQFPRNDDHPDARRPTFVDERGEVCAVGALYASDRGYAAAARIATKFKYAFIPEIADADLAAWQATSGLQPDELALIQPAYGWRYEHDDSPRPHKLWDAWGLTDRQLFGPARVSLTQEFSSANEYDTTTTTLYGHMRWAGARRTSMYLALPIGFVVERKDDAIAAAGGSPTMDTSRYWYGNADAGVFFGNENHEEGTASLHRIGALLPTATEHPMLPASARAGDVVMELPKSYGVRLATSRMVGWRTSYDTGYMVRFDAGFDYARGYDGEHRQHYVPRAALGLIVAKEFTTISLDTSVAHVFDESSDGTLRWTGGATWRFGLRNGGGCGIQPALTLAATRTSEGWGGVFALELAMAMKNRPPPDDDEY
jgi:hypothetical protein